MKNKPIEVVAAILFDGKKVLIGQRMRGDTNAGRWEFPGGKISAGESPEQALKREILEELGFVLGHFEKFMEIHHDYPNYSVYIRFYLARIDANIHFEKNSHADLKWIDPKEVHEIDFLEANQPVIRKLVDL